MKPGATHEEIDKVCKKAQDNGVKTMINNGEMQIVIALIGTGTAKIASTDVFAVLSGVQRVERVTVPFSLASRNLKSEDSSIQITPQLSIGGQGSADLVVMSGPCSVESEEGIIETARIVKANGAHVLRGGAYKPRTAPRTFEGLGRLGLQYLAQAKKESGLPVVTEVMDIRDIEAVSEVADILQVGARNMQNFSMLNELGRSDKPVLLKRGMSATIQEWLLAAERILYYGNPNVILCERGIRSFDSQYTRNVLDLTAVAVVKQLSHLPVIVDPSHGTGKSSLVPQMALASLPIGADGLIIEVHPDPENALSDGPQSLNPEQFKEFMIELKEMNLFMKQLKNKKKQVAATV